jgi:hypothetical protein
VRAAMWSRDRPRRWLVISVVFAVIVGGCGTQAHSRTRDRVQTNRQDDQIVARVDGVTFINQPRLRAKCAHTAQVVGYAVPCPTVLPSGLRATPGAHGCRLGIIGPGGAGACAQSWRSWIVGSSQLHGPDAGPPGFQHLVVGGAPKVVRDPARAIDGPGMVAGSRVQSRGPFRAGAIIGQLYYVPAKTNDGSAFMDHLAMVWTSSGHTYAYGFHVVATTAEARALDLEVAKHLDMVAPKHG